MFNSIALSCTLQSDFKDIKQFSSSMASFSEAHNPRFSAQQATWVAPSSAMPLIRATS